MAKNIDDIIKALPAARRKKIVDLSQKKIEEMLTHAATLTDFRKAVGKTQAEVAKNLGIKQNAVSQLEKRSDTYVSTLRRFLKSLDMTLELSVVAKNGTRIDLPNFLPGNEVDVVETAAAMRAKRPAAPATKNKARLVSAKALVAKPASKPVSGAARKPGTTTRSIVASHKARV